MRRRILLSIVGVAALAIVLFGVPLDLAIERANYGQAVIRLQREAAQAGARVPRDFATAGDPIELPAVTPDGASLALYGRDGRRVAGAGPPAADVVVRRALQGGVAEGPIGSVIAVAVPIGNGEAVLGAVRASLPAASIQGPVHQLWLAAAALGFATLVLAALLARWLAGRLSRPVTALASSAERLSQGDFGVEAPSSGMPELDAVGAVLASSARRISDTLARERAFSTHASHQLRTPVAALRVRLEAALISPTPALRDAVQDALGQLDRLEATVEDLLRLARDRPAAGAPLDLAAQLDDIERQWHGRLADRGRPLRVVLAGSLPRVGMSGAALRQILNVLLENSLEHGSGTVTITAQRRGEGAAVEVSDEGTGVTGDPESLFVSAHDERGRGGIGLPLARSLAEAEGARLAARKAGHRLTFTLYLAARPAAAPRAVNET